MYHYQVIDSITNVVVLDSSLRQDFDGYITADKAYKVALDAKMENRLSNLHVVKTFLNPDSGWGGIQRQREKDGFGI
jgi:hypothetical protein